MFFVMLVFALAISASQWASRIIVASVLDDVSVGDEVYRLNPETQQYGLHMVTEENHEEVREEQLQSAPTQAPLVSTLFFLIPIMFTLPIFWWVFRCKKFWSSWALTMIYGLAISAALLLLIFAVFGGGDLDFKMVSAVTMAVIVTSQLVWLPLVLLRLSGLELRTKRQDALAFPV